MSPRRVPRAGALLLAPGAGSSRDHEGLVAIEHAVAPLPVARMDFPYRTAGRKFPDPPARLIAAVQAEAEALVAEAGIEPERLVVGGRSMGGRICSMAVASGLVPAAGVVLVAYPLYQPGRTEKRRVEHLPGLRMPVLIVQGTRDPLGYPDDILEAAKLIPGPVTHVWIDKGNHSLKGVDTFVAEAVAAWIAQL
ncbi:MAG TPA: alpha/beta family hydrolase [Acidimicrobiales bacterium]